MKKLKKYISFILALFLLLTPLTAYAYGVVDGTGEVTVVGVKKDGLSFYQQFNVFGEDEQVRYNDSNNLQSNLEALSITARYTAGIQKGDILGIDFVIPLGRYKGFDFNIDCFTLTEKNTRSKTIFKYSGTINGNTDESSGDVAYYYSYSATASSSNTFHFEDACSFSYTGRVVYTVTLTNFVYSAQGLNLTFYLDDFTASIESPESGQSKKLLSGLSSIIEFVKNIFTKITELPQAIDDFINSLGDKISGLFTNLTNNIKGWFADVGKWFTDLGNNIKQWFTSLTNNLKTWFDSVGAWFKDIGDRISGFFTNLWNNISDSISNVTQSVRDWWNGLIEWFKNLWIIPDGYLDEYKERFIKWFSDHFGFLYQSIELSGALVQVLLNVFTKTPDGTITIPQITLPWGNHVIMQQTSFSFNDMVNSHSQFKWIFGLIRTASSAIVLVTFINYSSNLMNEFIKDRKENYG